MDALTQLQVLLQKRCGLLFSKEQQDDFFKHVSATLYDLGFADVLDLVVHLEPHPITHPSWQVLLNRVTIGETYFFRNQWHFQALRDRILPPLIYQRRMDGELTIRLWSAGCASGEEPYSLAILLQELIPDYHNWDIEILATDLNSESIAKAEKAIYGGWSFRMETPLHVKETYFTEAAGLYTLKSDVRHMVNFRTMNLIEDSYPQQPIDVILCRNVTIYFDRLTTQMVVQRFFDILQPNGWLIVGHSEPLASIYTYYTTVNVEGAVLYKKGEHAPHPPKATVPQSPLANLPTATILDELAQNERLDNVRKLIEQQNFATAQQELNAFLELMPDHINALFLLAKLLADEGQTDTVYEILNTIEELDPLVAQAHYLRALLLQQEQAPPNDIKIVLRRALYANRDFALAHFMMGELLAEEGNADLARRNWKNAHRILQNQPNDSLVPFGDGIMTGTLLHIIEERLQI